MYKSFEQLHNKLVFLNGDILNKSLEELSEEHGIKLCERILGVSEKISHFFLIVGPLLSEIENNKDSISKVKTLKLTNFFETEITKLTQEVEDASSRTITIDHLKINSQFFDVCVEIYKILKS